VLGAAAAALAVRSKSGNLPTIAAVDLTALAVLVAVTLRRRYVRARWDRVVADAPPLPLQLPRGTVVPVSTRLRPYLDAIRELSQSERAALLVEADGGLTVLVAVGPAASGFDAGSRLGADLAPLGAVTTSPGAERATVAPDSRLAPFGPSVCACRLETDGDVSCVVLVGRAEAYGARDSRRVEALAKFAGPAIDRVRLDDAERRSRLGADHARSHLALLAGVSKALSAALDDYGDALEAMAAIVVPDHADFLTADMVGPDGELEHLASVSSPAVVAAAPEPDTPWTETLKEVVRTGRSQLFTDVRPDDGGAAADPLTEWCVGQGLVSWAVVPMRRRGISVGALTVGTGAMRRGLRPSDVATFEELAGRCAVALERVALYQETRTAASQSERRANALLQAVEAAPVITDGLSVRDVLDRSVRQAARVMRAEQVVAVVEHGGEESQARWPDDAASPDDDELSSVRDEARQGNQVVRRSTDPRLIGVPLGRLNGANSGAMALTVPDGRTLDGEQLSVLMLLAEVTSAAIEHARLYEEATRSEQRVRALVEASPLAIIELLPSGEVGNYNAAAHTLLGWQGANGGSYGLHPETAEFVEGLRVRARRGERIVDERSAIRSGDGVAMDVSAAAAPLDGGEVLCVMTDITDRLQLEGELQQKRRMEALGRLAGGVAHDFNNLLTVMMGYADLVGTSLGPEHPLTAHVNGIRSSGRRAATLTEQLLTIGRRRMVEDTVFELNDALRGLGELLGRLIGDDVTLVTDLDPDAGRVRMALGQLEQVVLNLTINARSAMPDGGRLTIQTSASDGHVRLIVADTGVGMDAATRDRCFDPFFTTRRAQKGTGLGLATVYSIVEEAGGAISVDSEPGMGATFTVSLPRVEAEVTVIEPEPEYTRGDHPAVRVLLAEDDADVRALTESVLTSAGNTVHAAASGLDALALAEQLGGSWDVLVTDVVMPGMTGPELVEALRWRHGEIPVLFITGYADHDRWYNWQRPAVWGFLPKPFTPDQLLAALGQLLASRAGVAAQGSTL
jgi:PAS domain S-box-containing protein